MPGEAFSYSPGRSKHPTRRACLHLAASRMGEILEDFSEEVICKLILEKGCEEIHHTEKMGKGMERNLWQGNGMS